MTTDRLPPNNPEAERALLGCAILGASIVMPEIRSTVSPDAFFDIRHRALWLSAVSLFDAQRPIDEVSIVSALRQSSELEGVGGIPFISELLNAAPSPHAWSHYLEDLNQSLICRRLIQHATQLTARAYESPKDIEALLSTVESECLNIRQFATPKAEFVDWREVRRKTMDYYESAMSEQGRTGLRTGFSDLDRIIGGLRSQEFIVLAGTPSSGKTSLALNIARNAAVTQSIKTGVVSLETSGFKVVHRMNCIASGASGARLLNGLPLESDISMLGAASKELSTIGKHLLIYDRGAVNSSQAVSMMRRQYAQGARLFVLDYLQLLDAPQKTSNGNERMTLVSKAIKGAAKELDCPVIAISSLNRQSAKEGRAPTRSDLRETGQLEFDADVIILLHPNSDDPETRTVNVNVDKNKDGETGKVELMFFPPCMRFKNAAIEYQQKPTKNQHND